MNWRLVDIVSDQSRSVCWSYSRVRRQHSWCLDTSGMVKLDHDLEPVANSGSGYEQEGDITEKGYESPQTGPDPGTDNTF